MSGTLLDANLPLCAAPLPAARLRPSANDATSMLVPLVRQAMSLVRGSQTWQEGKQRGDVDPRKGGKVRSLRCPSQMSGRLSQCAWHARLSRHIEEDAGLSYDDFADGLCTNQHTLNESQYIPDITEALRLEVLKAECAEIWRVSYDLPRPTSNRDFVEMIITLQLPRSLAPFSQAHEDAALQILSDSSSDCGLRCEEGRRSFLVISVPVEHEDAAERPPQFVRAKYASVEAVWEIPAVTDGDASDLRSSVGVEWFMAVQSDASGRIPLTLQEMSMAGKIAKDVPLFVSWALKKKEKQATERQRVKQS